MRAVSDSPTKTPLKCVPNVLLFSFVATSAQAAFQTFSLFSFVFSSPPSVAEDGKDERSVLASFSAVFRAAVVRETDTPHHFPFGLLKARRDKEKENKRTERTLVRCSPRPPLLADLSSADRRRRKIAARVRLVAHSLSQLEG